MEDESFGLARAGGERSVDDVLAIVRGALLLRTPAQSPWLRLDEYLGDLAARNGAKHHATTKLLLNALRAACPGPTIAEVRRWRAAALDAGKSKATTNHYVGRLRTFLRWLGGPPHECAGLALLDVAQADLARRPRAFDDLELARFLEAVAALDHKFGGVPQVPTWRFLAETGFRWNEACGLDGAHVRGDVVHLPPWLAKNGKGRRVGPLSAALLESLRGRKPGALLLARRGKPWREVGHRVAHRCFVLACGRAELPLVDADGRSLTIHSLRRTAGTNWLRAGVPIAHVSRLLGHGSTAFTERVYIDLTADDPVEAVRALKKTPRPGDDSASATPGRENGSTGGPPR